MEVVMQYAIEKLGFPADKIVIYAWSIGECLIMLTNHIHVDQHHCPTKKTSCSCISSTIN